MTRMCRSWSPFQGDLPEGFIRQIADAADLEYRVRDSKAQLCCPFHDDRTPSAFLGFARNCFYCSVCTSVKGWSAKEFARRLGLDWDTLRTGHEVLSTSSLRWNHVPKETTPSFTAAMALKTWELAMNRMRSNEPRDAEVYDYLATRHLLPSRALTTFGVLGEGMPLFEEVRSWPRTGHCVVVPLVNETGAITNIQGRCIRPTKGRKVLFPKGSRAGGTVFASAPALQLMRGEWTGEKQAILAEGLTDYVAFTSYAKVPVFSAPGTGMAAKTGGAWARDMTIFLALDGDEAGQNAISETARALYENGARHVLGVSWPAGCVDACDYLQVVGPEEFRAWLLALLGGER